MDSLSTSGYIDWMEKESSFTLSDKLKAWQFGKKMPLLIGPGQFSFMVENALFPSNLFEIILAGGDQRIALQHFFFAEVSKVAVIPYPEGTDHLQELWLALVDSILKNKTAAAASTNCFDFTYVDRSKTSSHNNGKQHTVTVKMRKTKLKGLQDNKFTMLAVKLWLLPVSLFRGFDESTEKSCAAHFSLTTFSKPFNRLSRWRGSVNFCRLQFEFPHVKLADVVRGETDEGLAMDANEVQRRVLQYVAARLVYQQATELSPDQMWHSEQKSKYRAVSDFVHTFVGKTLKLFDKQWSLLSCNIAGALTYTYLYTVENRAQLASEVFTNPESVWDDQKPMLMALRLGLLNSTCVQSSCLRHEKGWQLYLVSDIATAATTEAKSVALNDGCGWVSQEAAAELYARYRDNWFSKVDIFAGENGGNSNNDNINYAAQFEADFLMTSDRLDIDSIWPSRDLPPPDTCDTVPSAFQIRFRGFKGMLVVSNELQGKTIHFTHSMKKFESSCDDEMFIVGISAPAHRVMLSSELITMFEGGCANQACLLEYLSHYLINTRLDNGGESLVELMRRPASFLSHVHASSSEINLINEKEMHLCQSPHFASRILRLNTPLPRSAHMYGVADYTGTLKPNQVYFNVTTHDGDELFHKPHRAIITKTPAMLNSHMRVFDVVTDCRELEHLRDVLVFSTAGNDLVTKQLSGADLDGDHFYVFWDTQLVDLLTNNDSTKKADNESGMMYSRAESEKVVYSTVNDAAADHSLHFNTLAAHFTSVEVSLAAPANSFDYCSLQHLLCLRRLFVDAYGPEWPRQELCDYLAKWITQTFEAPKHGSWLSWEVVRTHLHTSQYSIPPFPHYYGACAINSKVRTSSSLYARLSDRVWCLLTTPNCWIGGRWHQNDEPQKLALWLSHGTLELDVQVRSRINNTHYSVEDLDKVFGENLNPAVCMRAGQDSNFHNMDRKLIANLLVTYAPIYRAMCLQSNRHVAHLASSPSSLNHQMLIDTEFEGLLEFFVPAVFALHDRRLPECEKKDPWKFLACSLLTPALFVGGNSFLYPHLLCFMCKLDVLPTKWSLAQCETIGTYCEQKWQLLINCEDELSGSQASVRKQMVKDAVTQLKTLNKVSPSLKTESSTNPKLAFAEGMSAIDAWVGSRRHFH